MKNLLATSVIVLIISLSHAQTFSNSDRSECLVQVAYAVSEADGFGEYSITDLIDLRPGSKHDFRTEEFVNRRIYSDLNHDEVFILRFEASGITHFLDASASKGFETFLNGGCTIDQKPFLSKNGIFTLKASAN
ncbi:MAG: hypothetical protein WEC59_06295 [Salibacteraceae bacterium]